MSLEQDSNSKQEDNIPSKNNLFKGEDSANGDEVDGFKIDSKSDLHEDIEAIVQDGNIMGSNNSSSHNLNKSKINGYVRDPNKSQHSNKGEIEDLHKLSSTPRSKKEDFSKEGEREFDERGGSGMVNDAGNIDSPHNQTKNNFLKKDSESKDSDSKLQGNSITKLNKNNLGWEEESKNKIQSEDEKNDEERSLLDPIQENDVYSKELSSHNEDKDIRRSSTKPENKIVSESKDKSSGKGLEESNEFAPNRCNACKEKCNKFLESWQWGIFMTIITIYTLFFDDIRAAFCPKSSDDFFYTMTCISFCLFMFEIIFASIVQPHYLFSFFFWLDVLSTFSMIFDIGWIMNSFQSASQAGDFGTLAKSSRAARMTRIIRLVRLIRLVRIVKLYKQAKLAQQKREEARLKALREKKGIVDDSDDKNKKSKLQRQATSIKNAGMFAQKDDDVPVESKISKTLTEKNQKILIVLILVILFSNPLFLSGTFFTDDPACEIGLDHLMDIYEKTYKLGTNKDIYIKNYNQYVLSMKDYDYPIIKLTVPVYNTTYYNTPYSDLRDEELTEYDSLNNAIVYYSTQQWNIWGAYINIGRTIMVCILLTVSSYLINKDVNLLVLDPIERMIERIRIVAKNPMALCSEDEIESAGVLALAQSKNKKVNDKSQNETAFLEASLFTIGRLLGLCFGEAGARIIGNNIASSEIGSDFNPLIPGSKELAIFGFCDIRGFAEATLALEEEVMRFVNQIAEIVHSEADLHQGSSNKNLGEAFLMVWKFPRDDIDSFDDELSIRPDNRECNTIADLAVLSFLKTVTKINRYSHILDYSKNEKILERIKNYKVNMGFGIHYGWGIEGAIGSPYKIDASYLSPNVNIAARLEAATRQYGVSILISGELQEILTDSFKEITRLIDIVTVKGSAVPMKFYTINLSLNALEEEKAPFEGLLAKKKKDLRNEAKKELKTSVQNGIITTSELLRDESLMKMMDTHKSNQPEFKREYQAAFNKYIGGNWGEAILIFRKCSELNPEDGPVRTLIHYIESYNCKAPDSWGGFRPLTSK